METVELNGIANDLGLESSEQQLEEFTESTHINDTVFELLDITKDMLLSELESLRKVAETPYLTRTDVERVFDKITDILNNVL